MNALISDFFLSLLLERSSKDVSNIMIWQITISYEFMLEECL